MNMNRASRMGAGVAAYLCCSLGVSTSAGGDQPSHASGAQLEKLGAYVCTEETHGNARSILFSPLWRGRDEDLAALEHVPELTSLVIYDAGIGDQGLVNLTHVDSLTSLILCEKGVTDHGLRHLSSLRHLRILSLRETGLTDNGIRHLVDLPAIEILGLEYTNVTDSGLMQLGQLKKLRILRIEGTGISTHGIETFSHKMPKRLTKNRLK